MKGNAYNNVTNANRSFALKKSTYRFLLLITILFASSCGNQPSSEFPSGDNIAGEALIENAEIIITESFPIKVHVFVQGVLPDGCTTISRKSQSRSEGIISIEILTSRPSGSFCTEAEVPFEEIFDIDINGLTAGSYLVIINGVTVDLSLKQSQLVAPSEVTICPIASGQLHPYNNTVDGFCFLHPPSFSSSHPGSGVTILTGPVLNQDTESVPITLIIEYLGKLGGLSATNLADLYLGELENAGVSIKRGMITLGGVEGVTADGVPGKIYVRQIFTVFNDRGYIITISPIDPALAEATAGAELLWEIVAPSFTFINP